MPTEPVGGAPDVVPVADRFYRPANVGETLEHVLDRRRSALRAAAASVDRLTAESAAPVEGMPASPRSCDRASVRGYLVD